jgi:hypothetical protein
VWGRDQMERLKLGETSSLFLTFNKSGFARVRILAEKWCLFRVRKCKVKKVGTFSEIDADKDRQSQKK